MMSKLLENKTVLLGVSGSIAAYKAASLTSILLKMGAKVRVIMTKNATKFITPLTFSTYTNSKTYTDTFDENIDYNVEHISLAQEADIVIIAPASANVIAKLAHGIADDMLTTTVLATKAPILIAPAMNTNMYDNPATQDNIDILKKRGMRIIEPDTGLLACKTDGKGKMPEPEILAEHVAHIISREKDLDGKKVLISAGPTIEAIDPVRYITNHSTGKMGFALARQAAMMGAEVTIVSGCCNEKTPLGVQRVDVVSAKDMKNEIISRAAGSDIVIMAAAVADFTPTNPAQEKIKKKESDVSSIELKRTDDILGILGKQKDRQYFLCGFSMETQNVIENSEKKLRDKNLDMIVANDLRKEGAGFANDTNIVTLITRESSVELPIMSKDDVAYEILKRTK